MVAVVRIAGGVGTVLVLCGLGGFLGWYFTRPNDGSGAGGPYHRHAVATDVPRCSEIGNGKLRKGGSAVDAAITSMFCVGVINMHTSGIGGGGVMLVYNRSSREAKLIDFRETAPLNVANFTPNAAGVNQSKFGGLAIAVPGEVRGMYQAHQQYGRLLWKELVQPAIDLAEEGFEISPALSDALNTTPGIIEAIKKDPGWRELLLDEDGNRHKEGQRITNKKYANTLKIIRDDPESFYNGSLAKNITRDMNLINSTITQEDLWRYTAVARKPLKGELSNRTMYLSPPPTSGAVLALILNILKGYHMTPADRDGVNASVLTYHRIIEAFKFGYAYRSRLGDPDFNANVNKFAKDMMNQTLADELRQKIQDNRTHHNLSYYAQFYSLADYGTTHIAVLAENGDAVSVTSTINFRFGCRYRSTETGIIYNNEMADFDIPKYDVVDDISPSPYNFPKPGKRPFSSMTPTILTDNNGVVQLVIGASGGKRITTAVSLVTINKLWFDQTLSKAVDAPRLHTQLVPNQIVTIEKNETYRLDEKIVEGLKALGHDVRDGKDYDFAVVQAVYRKGKDEIYAKSDPRKFGEPAGN